MHRVLHTIQVIDSVICYLQVAERGYHIGRQLDMAVAENAELRASLAQAAADQRASQAQAVAERHATAQRLREAYLAGVGWCAAQVDGVFAEVDEVVGKAEQRLNTRTERFAGREGV